MPVLKIMFRYIMTLAGYWPGTWAPACWHLKELPAFQHASFPPHPPHPAFILGGQGWTYWIHEKGMVEHRENLDLEISLKSNPRLSISRTECLSVVKEKLSRPCLNGKHGTAVISILIAVWFPTQSESISSQHDLLGGNYRTDRALERGACSRQFCL